MTERIRMQVAGMAWTLHVAGRGRPVLFLHGFSGSSRSWAGLAGLGSRVRAIVPDLPGHGATGWEGGPEPDAGPADEGTAAGSPDRRSRASVERTADDLAAIVRRLGAPRVDVVGYSMGARIALRLAVAQPDAVGRLVLEAPSAGIADQAARAARVAADAERARLVVNEGVEAFAARWEAEPVLAGEAALPAVDRARQAAIRRSHVPLGLAASLIHAGQGAMEPLHDRLPAVGAPTLVIVGSDDPARARAEEVAAAIPAARLAVVPGAGHAPHLERPDRFHALLFDFLTETAS
ncbi:MAG TPA: alpha/beta fold hydrolase [Patescibacteria group bacterium]|nr:alpha/beta fold hydrolase [Patescibacteria group bacterium]